MIDEITGAPGAVESIVLCGKTYTMKCGTLAAFRLSEMKISAEEIFTVSDRERRVCSFAHVLNLFAATIAHNFLTRVPKEQPPSGQDIALMLEDVAETERDALVKEISDKTLSLIFPQLMALTKELKLRESAPKMEQPN